MPSENVNHLKEIIEALSGAKIRFVICGGVALVLQGVERATMDIDIAVSQDLEDMKSFLEVMEKYGLKPRVPVPPTVLLDPEARRMMRDEKGAVVFTFVHPDKPFLQVDVFLDESLTFEALKNDIDYTEMGDLKVPILSVEKLIEVKKKVDPPRDKDLWDIRALEKLLEKKKDG